MDIHVEKKADDVEAASLFGEMVERCQHGDVGAMEAVFLKYKLPMYNLAYRFLGNHALAEDVLQEIFIRVFMQIQNLHSVKAFNGWIYRIAVNACISAVRRQHRLKEGPLIDSERVHCYHDGHQLIKLDLEKAIHTLPRKQKMIFILHDLQGFTHPEIAKMMRLRTGTCKSQLFKARLKLRNFLKG